MAAQNYGKLKGELGGDESSADITEKQSTGRYWNFDPG